MRLRAPENRCSNRVSISGVGRVHVNRAPKVGQLDVAEANFTLSIVHQYIARLDVCNLVQKTIFIILGLIMDREYLYG
jgi:hypothetical protein